MIPTRVLLQAAAAAEHHTPLIRFLGKRSPPANPADPTPHAHPASPTHSLPDSFVQYRSKAQNHGPLGGNRPSGGSSSSSASSPSSSSSSSSASSSVPYYGAAAAAIGSHSGQSLGSVKPPPGQYFDRSELPVRFHRTKWTAAEIEAVETGGASLLAQSSSGG